MADRMIFVFPNGIKMSLSEDDISTVWDEYTRETGSNPRCMSPASFADRMMLRLMATAEQVE